MGIIHEYISFNSLPVVCRLATSTFKYKSVCCIHVSCCLLFYWQYWGLKTRWSQAQINEEADTTFTYSHIRIHLPSECTFVIHRVRCICILMCFVQSLFIIWWAVWSCMHLLIMLNACHDVLHKWWYWEHCIGLPILINMVR